MEFGQVAYTASGSPLSPSQHTMNTSWTPSLARSAHTYAQNAALSLSAIHLLVVKAHGIANTESDGRHGLDDKKSI